MVANTALILLVSHQHRVVVDVGVLEGSIGYYLFLVGHSDLDTKDLDLIIAWGRWEALRIEVHQATTLELQHLRGLDIWCVLLMAQKLHHE
jgi:hypothetical protein